VVKALKEAAPGIRISWVYLHDLPIQPCQGFYSEDPALCEPRRCTSGQLADGMAGLHQKVLWSDVLLIGTPVYWYGIPGHLKNFLDRLTSLENVGKLLDGKVAGFAVAAKEDGASAVIRDLMLILNDMGVLMPPYAFTYTTTRPPDKDPWALRYARQLGQNIARLLALRGTEPWWRYPGESE
jgi:multimeric flavodoxin WrbA